MRLVRSIALEAGAVALGLMAVFAFLAVVSGLFDLVVRREGGAAVWALQGAGGALLVVLVARGVAFVAWLFEG